MLGDLRDWYRSTFGHALVGAALFWLALPPVNWWPLAWIAPVWWVLLVRRERLPPGTACPHGKLLRPPVFFAALVVLLAAWMTTVAFFHGHKYEGFWLAELVFWPLAFGLLLAAVRIWPRPYVVLWWVGFAFWLAALQWLRLPHWATGFGWLALSFYFAFYLPVFIGLSRVAVHRLRVPVVLAVPVVWAGLELARAHLLTGFTMGNLGHTQYRWTGLIQISDLTGDYGVGFVVMFVAACLARMIKPRSLWPLLPAAALLAAVLAYGYLRTSGDHTQPGPRVALIQGNLDTKMKSEEGFREKGHQHYFELSVQAIKRFGKLDLLVWPETMYMKETEVPGGESEPIRGLLTCSRDALVPEQVRKDHPTVTSAEFCDAFQRTFGQLSRNGIVQLAADLQAATGVKTPPMVLGVDQERYAADGLRSLNSAVFVDADGRIANDVYSKMHLVMFGEYVPFAGCLPWLQRLTPLDVSASAGDRPEVFQLGPWRVAPNICYETVLSHVIRRQVNALKARDAEPDVLVNLTNDGWFWGSNELEMHLACGVFRAVECRKPLLIAANTGISAWIDGDGRLLARAPRHAPEVLLAEARLDQRRSWYLAYGDWPAGICLTLCLVLAAVGLWAEFPARRVRTAADTGVVEKPRAGATPQLGVRRCV